MTAHDLIESILARPMAFAGPNVRPITPDQLSYLRDLIQKDPESAKVRNGQGGSLVWSPAGKHKYVLTEDPTGGKKHSLTRISHIEAEGQASLF